MCSSTTSWATESNTLPCDVPRLVDTGRGFSVSYKGRFLYSKYAPEKAALSVADGFDAAEGTLVLVCSPCLCYGLDALKDKLAGKTAAMVAAVEKDKELYRLAAEHFTKSERCVLLDAAGAQELVRMLSCGECGAVRRAVRLDFSGGVQFNSAFYDDVFNACTDAIARYWKNRATLIRFGRLYSRNLFRNIARLPHSVHISSMAKTVQKPIAVFGAGESMEKAAHCIAKARERYYVVSVDAALGALLGMKVVPDCIVTEEAQSVIAEAFIGTDALMAKKPHAFLSASGWSGAFDAVSTWASGITYYATEYCPAKFLKDMVKKGVLPPLLPPLGSVGLTAVRLSLMMRQNESIPVFAAGLDFSYSVGATHARGTPACIKRLSSSTRLDPCEAYSASFCGEALKAGAQGERRTMPNMALYAALFNEQFGKEANLFDAGALGLPLGIPKREIEAAGFAKAGISTGSGARERQAEACDASRVRAFYDGECSSLQELRQLLSGEGGLSSTAVKERVFNILHGREYLYLHFPDCNEPCLDAHFLARVKTEADFFLKDMAIGIGIMERQ